MTHVLIAEDNPAQAELIQERLERAGYTSSLAENGVVALELLELEPVDVVLADLTMPELGGLQLVEILARQHPKIPAILMTSQGSEEIAAEALQKGACSYIPKRRLEQDLLRTLDLVLGLRRADRRNRHLATCWVATDQEFELDSVPELIPPFVAYIQDQLSVLHFGDESTITRISVALTETLDNALHHGNWELSSELRFGDGQGWRDLARVRRHTSPFRDRKIYVRLRLSREVAEFVIRDEGQGFDAAALPDPTQPSRLESASGRGVYLVRMFMDEVRFNGRGNEITLIKRRPA